ncbi:transporter substrate-binding domain-containing protein [Reyranella sp. CPCC 100927]|uniref:transporter substrate-binding domain-containing protein n=1 Tax=Reyranella sp. CPCC 100927 TaxID=2599616 RepID=UPI0015B5C35D|nr:transporter substrate-binding domain-containing protein [Reyranella sp. CPCC 100927]
MFVGFLLRLVRAPKLTVCLIVAAVALTPVLAAAQAPNQPSRPRAAPAPKGGKPAPKPPAAPAAPKATTVVTEGNFPPFNMVDAQGKPAGFEVELAQAICQRAKIECKIVVAKWDEIIPGLLDKRYDIAMASLQITSERRKHVAFSRRYYTPPAAFVTAKEAAVPDGAPVLMRGKTVGTQRATTFADYLDRTFRKTIKLRQFPTAEEARRELVAGKVDAVLGDKVSLWKWLGSPEGACCAFFGQDIKDTRTLGEGVAAGFRKDDPKLRETFNKALAELLADGTHKKIADRYFPFAIY